jgi:hypothetical protein
VRDAVGVALDGDGSGESGDRERAVDLRQRGAESVARPIVACEECGGSEDEGEGNEDGDGSKQDQTKTCGGDDLFRGVLIGEAAGKQGRLKGVWIVGVHVLTQSLNGASGRTVETE